MNFPLNTVVLNTVELWSKYVSDVRNGTIRGIGLKCPFCGTFKVHSIGSGILTVDCGTRICISRNPGKTTNVVTLNSHADYTNLEDYYPYREFNCQS